MAKVNVIKKVKEVKEVVVSEIKKALDKLKFFCINDFKKYVGVHITTNHTGKMRGMISLSTSCLCNKYCKAYAKDPKKVCHKCYAVTQMNYQKSMQPCFEKNTKILTESVIPKEYLPIINAAVFRFEAFGDIQNETQVINYFNICKKNKHVNFALWTKNPAIIDRAIKSGHAKPKNLQIVLSSHYLNKVADINRWSFVDKIFTVFTKDYIEENNVKINCKGESCLLCQKCYHKNKEIYMNEELRGKI